MENCVLEEEYRALIEASRKDSVEKLVVGIFIELKCKSQLESETKILIVKRTGDEKFLPNVEEIPGGGIEFDESIPETIVREAFEETGLKVTKILRYVNQFDYPSRKGRLTRQFNFVVEVNGGKIINDEDIKLNPKEHSAFKWVGKNDLDNLTFTSIESGMKTSLYDYFNISCEIHR